MYTNIPVLKFLTNMIKQIKHNKKEYFSFLFKKKKKLYTYYDKYKYGKCKYVD